MSILKKYIDNLKKQLDLLPLDERNSANVVEAIKTAKTLGITSYAIVGFSGGQCKELADHSFHIEVDDMQISEDFQCIVGHMLMQWLHQNNPRIKD